MIKAIIFDYFDVLRPDGFNAWLRRHGLRNEGEITKIIRKHDEGELDEAEMFTLLGKHTAQSASDVEREMEADTEPDWGMIRLVRSLRQQYRIGLLSNSAADYLRNELRRHDLENDFDVIVISAEVGMAKPDADIFTLMADKLGVAITECAFVDDNPGHIKAANNLGITGLLFEGREKLRQSISNL